MKVILSLSFTKIQDIHRQHKLARRLQRLQIQLSQRIGA